MSNAIATAQEKPLEKQQENWQERMELVKQKVGSGLTKTEWELFLYMARLYDLNPLLREIWAVKYNGKPANIFTGRDGLLKIAHKSGMFDGMRTVLLVATQTGVEEADIAPKGAEILGAKCYVWRKDMSHPVEVSVKLSEYDTHRSTWKEKPDTMIRKVAEAHCLRRTFSIHGLYLPEEFKQAQNDAQNGESINNTVIPANEGEPKDEPEEEKSDPKFDELPKEVQRTIIQNTDHLFNQLSAMTECDKNQVKNEVFEQYDVSGLADLSYTELRNLYRDLSSRVKQIA
ncbi:MAG TPA: phage recombination protein Bet [Thermotogota bacterium]|nr:phage recombination protein Bet [Thermotogota bacterium]